MTREYIALTVNNELAYGMSNTPLLPILGLGFKHVGSD